VQLKDKECPQKFSSIKFSSSFSFLFELLLLRKYTKYNLTGSKSSIRKEKYEENIIELNSCAHVLYVTLLLLLYLMYTGM